MTESATGASTTQRFGPAARELWSFAELLGLTALDAVSVAVRSGEIRAIIDDWAKFNPDMIQTAKAEGWMGLLRNEVKNAAHLIAPIPLPQWVAASLSDAVKQRRSKDLFS